MSEYSRRGFLRTGLSGAGALAVAPAMGHFRPSDQEKEIIHRTLGRTGLKVPVVSFGVMRSDSPNLCKAAYDKGIRLFDTANGYQGGNNETMLGNLFRDFKRDSFLIATKVKPVTDRDGKPNDQTSADKFLEMFNQSMSRLGMDYVDILYVHDLSHPDMLDYKPIVNAVKKLKKEGKIRFMGFSTHRNEHIMISAAAETDTWEVILTQYNYRMATLPDINSAIKKAGTAGIGLVAMKTLAGGGFLDRERTKPMNTTAAIKWVLSNPDIATTIPGMTSFDQLDLNSVILSDIELSAIEKQDLLAADGEEGLICSGCDNCTAFCSKGLPVRDLMRAYMYAYGYSMPSMAKDLLAGLKTGHDPCAGCNACTVPCHNGFDLKAKIADISRLEAVPAEFLA